MKKDHLIIIFIIVLGLGLYTATLRGAPGNPESSDFKNNLDTPTKSFELSPERGRFVEVVNLAERGTYALNKTWADVAYPDVGVIHGDYFSFFAPGVSYMTLPFYIVGASFGLAQIATFSAEALLSILTLVLVYLIGKDVFKLPTYASLFAVIVFGFGSTAWSYSVTLYQHAFTTFFIVSGFYAVWKYDRSASRFSFLYPAYIWAAYALSIFVDYPNAILMLPVIIYLAFVAFSSKNGEDEYGIAIRFGAIFTAVVFVAITGLHFWHNSHYFGSWKQLSGGLPSYHQAGEVVIRAKENQFSDSADPSASIVGVIAVPIGGTSSNATGAIPTAVEVNDYGKASGSKDVIGFFSERRIPHGLQVLLVSSDRGLFFFTPIFLLSLLGMLFYFRNNLFKTAEFVIPVALIAVNLFLYSSWGDPWGGWAFGPRYLIPSMPWLAIFAAIYISNGGSRIYKKLIAFILFLYSSGVALLGALTSNAVPQMSEGILLPAHKYNYLLNIDFLQHDLGGSFVYNTFFSQHLTLLGYFIILYAIVVIISAILLFSFRDNYEDERQIDLKENNLNE